MPHALRPRTRYQNPLSLAGSSDTSRDVSGIAEARHCSDAPPPTGHSPIKPRATSYVAGGPATVSVSHCWSVLVENCRFATSAGAGAGGPPTHWLFEHVSPVVHGSPSSQESVFAVKTQPIAESQLSVVQGFESSHTRGTNTADPVSGSQ
jgi:hypothetical protein